MKERKRKMKMSCILSMLEDLSDTRILQPVGIPFYRITLGDLRALHVRLQFAEQYLGEQGLDLNAYIKFHEGGTEDMSNSGRGNLPPGCKDSDIPGNSSDDIAYEQWLESNERTIAEEFVEDNADEIKMSVVDSILEGCGEDKLSSELMQKYESKLKDAYEREKEGGHED